VCFSPLISCGMCTVLVTGGTGFFGHNLVSELLTDDRVRSIRVYARHAAPTEYKLSGYGDDGFPPTGMGEEPCERDDRVLQSHRANAIFSHPKVTCYQGDITDKVALRTAMEGCTVVFHACGDTRWWNAVERQQGMTNVGGTIAAVDLAMATPSVKRFVYTSTVDVMGTGNGELLYETDEGIPFDYNYAVTKSMAENMVRYRAVAKDLRPDLRITVIRPGSMIGPWDVTNQYGRLFYQLKWGSILGVPCGGTSVCHVQDVARAHIAAAFAPSLEHVVYVCAGMNVTYRHLFRTMRSYLKDYADGKISKTSRIGPCCVPCEVMPETLLVAYGWMCEVYSNRVSGTEPEVNPGMARYLSKLAYFVSPRAEEELGYPSQSEGRWLDAIKESYEWYRVRGRV